MSNYYQMSRVDFHNWDSKILAEAAKIMKFLSNCLHLDDEQYIVEGEAYSLNLAIEKWPWLEDKLIELAGDWDMHNFDNFEDDGDCWYYENGISDCNILAELLSAIAWHYKLDTFESKAVIYDIGYDDKRIEGHHTIYTIRTGYCGTDALFSDDERDLLQLQLFAIYHNGIEAVANIFCVSIETAVHTIEDAVNEFLSCRIYSLERYKHIFCLLHAIRQKTSSEQLSIAMSRIINRYNVNTDNLELYAL